MKMMNDDLLDAEYRQILYIIKHQINNINDCYQLERYRLWLERLSSVSPKEKLERNKFLIELANQIHDNALKVPFTHDPPRGLLPSLSSYKKLMQTPADISQHFFKKETDKVEWPYLQTKRSSQSTPKIESKESSPRKKLSKPKVQPFQKLGTVKKNEEIKSTTSSWYDLTDTTQAEDTDVEENEKTKIKQKDSKQRKKSSKEDVKEEQDKSTPEELEALKMRMKDLLEVKNALKDTHCLTEDRKKTVETLQVKLSRAEQQNSELQQLIDAQQKDIVDLEKVKTKELNDFKEKYTKLRQKEIEYLKEYHKNEIIALEKKYTSKLVEMQTAINSLKREYESKIEELTESNMSLLKKKDSEIQQLQTDLKVKISEASKQGEGSGEQLINLKRCISKLNKVLHRNEKEYLKKIERLKQELEVKDVTNQVQLQTQRADLIVRNTASKQEELKSALSLLEEKYKKMMDTVQFHALEAKKHDEKLIDDLKNLLRKHNIEY